MEKIAKRLTDQFYAWECRGRGTLAADGPCELEPPFHPFFYHAVPTPYIDDGRRPTIVSSVIDFFKGKNHKAFETPEYEEPEIEPFPFEDSDLHAYTIVLPKGFKTPSEQTIQLLTMLSQCSKPLSYEIHATHTAISLHLVCREEDAQLVRAQFRAYFPDVTLHDNPAYIEKSLPGGIPTGIVDFCLAEECTRPMAAAKGFDLDPYIPFFALIEHLEYGETVLLQTQFVATINAWAESILSSVTTYRGECFFMDAPEMLPLAKEKVSMPLYAATVKLAVQASDSSRIYALFSKVINTVTAMTRGGGNRLIPAPEHNYEFDDRFDDIALRQSHRLGMLLNVRELATLAHFPSYSVHSDKLVRSVTRTKAAPAITTGHAFVLGKNIHQDKEKLVSLSEQQRMRHMHIIGATGTGKSTLLQNLIYQDIVSGSGLAVIDPHGDLIETILTVIPASRKNDVVVIDPFDSEYPVRCNILHAATDIERELISSDLVALFRRFSTSWGDQMNSVFANAILAFVESTKGGTLLDLRRFLIEKPFRDSFLQTVKDPGIIYYWQKEFPLLKSSSIGPILTKLDAFLRPKVIRNMVSQKESLPVAEFMDTKKIVLIKLSQGLIGAENSYLLGALLVSKIHQAAMARQLQSKDNRIPFYLYIDEFQHFITPSMSEILSGARKYQLGLVLVHQSMEQVTKADSELAHALLANAGTRVCFRLGNADAKKLEEGLGYFTAADLQNLSTGDAIARVNRAADDFSLHVRMQKFLENLQGTRDDIIEQSRRKYTSPMKHLAPESGSIDTESYLECPTGANTGKEANVEKHENYVSTKEPFTQATAPPLKKDADETAAKKPGKAYDDTANETEDKERVKQPPKEHRYLQILLGQLLQERGYKCSIEYPLSNGKVDLLAEKDNITIACEISVTTDLAWEWHNLEKCLLQPFNKIVSISRNERFLTAMRKKVETACSSSDKLRLLVTTPEGLIEILDKDPAKSFSEEGKVIKGYRIKIKHISSDQTDQDTQLKQERLNSVLKKKSKN